MNEELITKTNIKNRGWTDGAINVFLGDPDKTKINPHYRSGPKMKLWKISSVIEIENSIEFKNWEIKNAKKREKLSNSLKNRHKENKRLIFEWLDNLQIKIPKYSKKYLSRFAIESYNNLWISRGKIEKEIYGDYRSLDVDFLNRITYNAIKHNLVDYNYYRNHLKGISGVQTAVEKLDILVENAISKKYPDFDFYNFGDNNEEESEKEKRSKGLTDIKGCYKTI